MRTRAVVLLSLLLMPAGLARAARPIPPQPAWALPRVALGFFATGINNLMATPNPVSLSAPDPDSTPSPQSLPVTVTWKQTNGNGTNTWNLTVTAPASFPGCPAVAVSDVTVTCDSVSSDNTNGGWTGVCAASTPLNSSGVLVASGTEGNPSAKNITVNLHYTLADSWSHTGGSCSLPLTYTLTAN